MQVLLDHIDEVADHIRTFWFKAEKKPSYTAGQYIELTLPHDNPDERGQKHWFTLSSSPTDELISITTKFPAKGPTSTFKQTLQNLDIGASVSMSQPMGDFVLPKDTSIPLVFVAGGIGITPIHSMIKWLSDTQEQRTIDLLYAANRLPEVAFTDLFTSYGIKPQIVLSEPPDDWQGLTGHISADRIIGLYPDADNKLYYMSGPEPMVETLFADLKARGVAESRLVADYFPGYEPI